MVINTCTIGSNIIINPDGVLLSFSIFNFFGGQPLHIHFFTLQNFQFFLRWHFTSGQLQGPLLPVNSLKMKAICIRTPVIWMYFKYFIYKYSKIENLNQDPFIYQEHTQCKGYYLAIPCRVVAFDLVKRTSFD